jgi:DNA topoisomerase-3
MLILCEKPSVAKDFAGALRCETKKGYYQNKDIVITYCVGHLYELCKPESYNSAYKTWDIHDLPIIPSIFRYEKIDAVAFQTEIVLSLLKKNAQDTIVIATDAGREGELIARIVLYEAGITNFANIRRFWASEALTKDVILNGLQNAKPLINYDKISQEGFTRQHADWLIGINLTRYMTIGNSTLFSIGRVQTAILSAIALRNQEVAYFVPIPFIELEATLKSTNGISIKAWLINPKSEKTAFFEDKEVVMQAQQFCRQNEISNVQSHTTKEAKRPDKLLNITGLQKIAYKRYGYSPEKTLDLAQSLYEKHKCLSYPRTPSRVMGDQNVDLFQELFHLLSQKYPQYSQFCDESLITRDNKNIFNSAALEDHHALIPLSVLPEEATSQERSIYEIVLKSFFMVSMKDFIFNKKQLFFYIGNYIFRSQIHEIIQMGFKEVIKTDKDDTENNQEVDKFNENTCKLIKLDILQKATGPKKEYSIDTLLGFMESPHNEQNEKLFGLGTPATRSTIIKTLFDRQYIREEKKKIYASHKGLFLLAQLQKDEDLKRIANIEQTTEWEKQLASNPEDFEKTIIQYLKSCIKNNQKETYTAEPLGTCPLCGDKIFEGKKNYYCSGYKAEKPCTYVIWKSVMGATLNIADVQLLLSHYPTTIKNCVSKAGKKFKASFFMESAGKICIKFSENKKFGKAAGKSIKQGAINDKGN